MSMSCYERCVMYCNCTGCEFGDRVGWCSQYIQSAADCRQPSIAAYCCHTCQSRYQGESFALLLPLIHPSSMQPSYAKVCFPIKVWLLVYKVNCGRAATLSAQSLQRQHNLLALGKKSTIQTTVYLGSRLSSETEPFCTLDWQHGTTCFSFFIYLGF